MQSIPLSSVPKPARLVAIDVLRGVAVLGILLMNIQSFGLPDAAYFNPTVLPASTSDSWVFNLSYVLAESKFMTLFSLLFGTSLALMSDRRERAGETARGYLVRRHLWLALFGAIHAYLLWPGDVLLVYALCAFLIMGTRHWSATRQIALATALLAVPGALFLSGGGAGVAELQDAWQPSPGALAQEVAVMQGSWWGQLPLRAKTALEIHLWLFPLVLVWRVCGLMLLGMALYRLGVTSARRSGRFYQRLMLAGFGLGLPLASIGLWLNIEHQWQFDFAAGLGQIPNYVGSLLVAGGYLGLVMWACQRELFPRLLQVLANAGRMALTLYLSQTLIATSVFYGHGLGWFGQLSRLELMGVCLAMWVVLLGFASAWLARFEYGPMEGLWRWLCHRQPRDQAGTPAALSRPASCVQEKAR